MYERHDEAVLQWLVDSLDFWAAQHDSDDSTKIGTVAAIPQESSELRYCTVITTKHFSSEVVDIRARFRLAVSGVPDEIDVDVEACGIAPHPVEGKERPYCVVSAKWYATCNLARYDENEAHFGEFIFVGDNETCAKATVRAVARKMHGTLRDVAARYATLVEYELL